METDVKINDIYMPSENIVAREVQGEFVIIPIVSGIGDMEEEIFSLNETARAIWGKLDGKKTLKDIAISLVTEFQAPVDEIGQDILGLAQELLKRKMLVCVNGSLEG
jgi:hypothetical protein